MSISTEKEEIAEGLANELIDFVNTFGQCYEVFAKTICKSHRYLQGEVFLLMIEVIREMSKNEYDERNEYAVRKCKEIVSLLDN